MSLAHRLAGALGRKDLQPNVELARAVVDARDAGAVVELLALVEGRPRRQRHDAVQVLFEIGKLAPELLVPHLDDLVDLLEEGDNRVLWGALYALSTLTELAPEGLMANLGPILDAAERSSVIARDCTVRMLVALAGDERYHDRLAPELLRMVDAAAVNQFPTYAERASTCLSPAELPRLVALIEARGDFPGNSGRRSKVLRMQRLLRKIAKRLEA